MKKFAQICLAVFCLAEIGVNQSVSGKSRKLFNCLSYFSLVSDDEKKSFTCFFNSPFLASSASLLFMLHNIPELRYEVLE